MSAPEISLPCFEGPLDLLLSLVRRHEIEITDLPIADITRQYLDYLRRAAQLDLDLGAEFVYMAAWLIEIKTRCLLAGRSTAPDEDPRQELVRQLLDHSEVRQAAGFLQRKLGVSELSLSRSEVLAEPPGATEEPVPGGGLNLLQILRLTQQALATARAHDFATSDDSVTVEEMTGWLVRRIAGLRNALEAQSLLEEQPDAPRRIALFLSMLDLAGTGRIRMEQERPFGPIKLTAG